MKVMKIKNIIGSAVCAGMLAVVLSACVTEKQKEAKLEAQAKVSRAEAEKIALAKAPGGTIKAGEIEREKGKVIWSFDIAMPGTKDITEVQVDAMTGEVVAVEKETPSEQAKEKKKHKEEGAEKEEKK
jgi:hypothetical protein